MKMYLISGKTIAAIALVLAGTGVASAAPNVPSMICGSAPSGADYLVWVESKNNSPFPLNCTAKCKYSGTVVTGPIPEATFVCQFRVEGNKTGFCVGQVGLEVSTTKLVEWNCGT